MGHLCTSLTPTPLSLPSLNLRMLMSKSKECMVITGHYVLNHPHHYPNGTSTLLSKDKSELISSQTGDTFNSQSIDFGAINRQNAMASIGVQILN